MTQQSDIEDAAKVVARTASTASVHIRQGQDRLAVEELQQVSLTALKVIRLILDKALPA